MSRKAARVRSAPGELGASEGGAKPRGTSFRRKLARLAAAALLFTAGWYAALIVPDPLRPSADAVVPRTAPEQVRIAAYSEAGGGIEVAPVAGHARTLLVLYPGGLVRPHAYTWIGVGLAPMGIRTLIPTMPLDLAVFGRDRAARLIDELHDDEVRIAIAGHSLGGAMAASFVARHPERVDALVLLGAYPGAGTDLSHLTLPTLVVAASQDGLSTLSEVRDGMARLPAGAGLEQIDGAVHAFFGRYGPQRGDGLPLTTRARAEDEILGSLEAFLTLLP